MTVTLALHEPVYLIGITEKPTVLRIEDIEASENVCRKSRLAATPAQKTSAMPLR